MKYLIKSDIGYWIIVVLLTATGCSGSEKTVSQSYALSAPSEIIAEQIDDCRVKSVGKTTAKEKAASPCG